MAVSFISPSFSWNRWFYRLLNLLIHRARIIIRMTYPIQRVVKWRMLATKKHHINLPSLPDALSSLLLIFNREGLTTFDPTRPPLSVELSTAKFTILPARDANGATLALFNAHREKKLVYMHYNLILGHLFISQLKTEAVK